MDDHRARRVLCTLLADRAEQESDEAAVSPRSHNEKVRAAAGLDQDLCCRSLDRVELDLEVPDSVCARTPQGCLGEGLGMLLRG